MTRASDKAKAAAKAKREASLKHVTPVDPEHLAIVELMKADNQVALERAMASEALVSELTIRIRDVQIERDTCIEHYKKHREQDVTTLRAENDQLYTQLVATQGRLIDIGDTWFYTSPFPALSGSAVSAAPMTPLSTPTTSIPSTPDVSTVPLTPALFPVKLKASFDSCVEHAPFKLLKKMVEDREAQFLDMETEFEKSTSLRDARIKIQRANIDTLEGCIRDSQVVYTTQTSDLTAAKLKIGTMVAEITRLKADLAYATTLDPVSTSSVATDASLAQVATLQDELLLAHSNCHDLESQAATTATTIKELTATVDSLTFDLDSAELRVSTLEIDLKEANHATSKTYKMTVPQISSQLMLPVLSRLPQAIADLHYFEVSLLFGEDFDMTPVDSGDQQKKTVGTYPTFPTIPLTTAKTAPEEARLAEFAYTVDEFALQHAGSLSDVTIGRFASDRVFSYNPSLMMELGGGAQKTWTVLRGLILAHAWSHTLVVHALSRFLSYNHSGGTTFKDFVRELVRRYLFFRSVLVTNEMFPHLSGYAIILIALLKIHDNMLPVYVRLVVNIIVMR